MLRVKNLLIYPGRGCQAFVYRTKCEVHYLLALLRRRWPLRGSEKSILRIYLAKSSPHPAFVL